MNCLDSDIGEPIKAAAFEEKDALIGVPVSFYKGLVRSLSVARRGRGADKRQSGTNKKPT
ncbi:hypothetical protein CDL15_Pgr026177 [Punica granatum]|uniref:Uncharacterized protein n=1 Tax=Punica granatum TaxID=22663 RepID=A0A218XLG7_PUNGR|nr:hypothetical protein CDL15_Pgr026177 [Punica granatum]